jgi:hypothetical protein
MTIVFGGSWSDVNLLSCRLVAAATESDYNDYVTHVKRKVLEVRDAGIF